MKKLLSLIIGCTLMLLITACSKDEISNIKDEVYTLNGSVAYGSPEGKGLEETEVSYEMIVTGEKADILNIDAYQPLVNPLYIDLLLENGPHHTEVSESQDLFKVTGSFIFDTSGKTKEEISEMSFYKGTEIYDKDGTKYELIINDYVGE